MKALRSMIATVAKAEIPANVATIFLVENLLVMRRQMPEAITSARASAVDIRKRLPGSWTR